MSALNASDAVTFRYAAPVTPAGTPLEGALGLFEIDAPDSDSLDELLKRLSRPALAPGALSLAPIGGVDEGLVARWSPSRLSIMPHGGPHICKRIRGWLIECGIIEVSARDEPADSGLEEAITETLWRAASPLAVDVLLAQPQRWRDFRDGRSPGPDDHHDALLNRLLVPPLVVAIGASNIGKSTLTNALARRQVSIVADQPGTTRDHVGITLNMQGLVIRWVDTPGVRADADSTSDLDREGVSLSRSIIDQADLVVSCLDHVVADAPPPAPLADKPLLRLAIRADLGSRQDADLSVSSKDPASIARLSERIRDRLLPRAALIDPRPWRFRPDLVSDP